MLASILSPLVAIAPGDTSPPAISEFIMWDYRDGISGTQNLQNYHTWLIGWCTHTPPPRLVLYVTSPCAPHAGPFGTFYDPSAAADPDATAATFVDFLVDLKAAAPGVEVECMIDNGAYPDTSASAPCGGIVASTQPTLALPSDWSGLPLFLDWMDTLLNNSALVSAAPVGMTLDPEFAGVVPSQACTSVTGSNAAYQQLIDYIDAWRVANGHETLRSGMTFQVDAATFTLINVSDFPLSAGVQFVLAAGSPELHCQLGTDQYPPWRNADAHQGSPLLDSAYMQVYVGSGCDDSGQIPTAGTFWRWATVDGCRPGVQPTARTPLEAATSLQHNMVQKAGSPGPGTVEVTDAGRDLDGYLGFIGTDTLFTDWVQYSRVRCIKPDGTTLPTVAQWKLKGIASDTSGTGYGVHQSTDGQSLPYTYTELLFNWTVPPATSSVPQRVVFMFSAEKKPWLPFFGWWTLPNFRQFAADLTTLTDGSDADHAVFLDAGGSPLAVGTPWAIYSLKTACDAWGIGDYGGTSTNGVACAANLAGTETIGMASLIELLLGWHTPQSDLTGDGETGAQDIHLLLSVWGQSCQSPDLACP